MAFIVKTQDGRKLTFPNQPTQVQIEEALGMVSTPKPEQSVPTDSAEPGMLANMVGPERSRLVPDILSSTGREIEKRVPKKLRPGLKFATDTLKGQAFGPGFGGTLARETVEKPELAGRVGGAIFSPAGTAVGLGLKKVAEETVPEKYKDVAVPVAELLGGVLGEAAGGAILNALKKPIGKFSGRLINNMVKPKNKDFMFGKNPGQEIANQGIVANSLDDLAVKVETKIDVLEKQLVEIVSKSNKSVQTNKILTVVDDSIAELSKLPGTNKSKITALGAFKEDISNIVSKKKEVTMEDALAVKRLLGKQVKWASALGDDVSSAVAKTIRKTYGIIDDLIDEGIPATKGLNRSMANLISARNAILSRIPNEQRNAIIGLLPRLTGIAAGTSVGGPVGGIAGFLGVAAAEKAITSPAVTTRAAKALAKVARPGKLSRTFGGVK